MKLNEIGGSRMKLIKGKQKLKIKLKKNGIREK